MDIETLEAANYHPENHVTEYCPHETCLFQKHPHEHLDDSTIRFSTVGAARCQEK